METSSTGSARDSLRNLTALLTLARAKEELGFTPEQYGLSEKQAANVALVRACSSRVLCAGCALHWPYLLA